jgi:ABC-type branched-subunit amino acid transport system substrate-binding protein
MAPVALVAAGGCSTTAPAESAESAGGIRTGPGVTEDTITVGAITDLTGPFAAVGRPRSTAAGVLFEQINADGGICDRQIEYVVRDHQFDVQTAVTLYNQIEAEVLGLAQFLGSAQLAAVLPSIREDEMPVAPVAFASTSLGDENVLTAAATLDVQALSGLEYLIDQGTIAEGDRIGIIYSEGETGADVQAGAAAAAEAYDLELIESTIKPSDTDVSGPVTNLRSQGAEALVVFGPPTVVASAAAVAESLDYNIPIVTWVAGFSPGLLATAAGQAIQERVTIAATHLPVSAVSDVPEVADFLDAYQGAYPDEELNQNVMVGYSFGRIYATALEEACSQGDLSRAGVVAAMRSLDAVNTGVQPELDLTDPDVSPSKAVYIVRPDPSVPGGLSLVQPEPYAGPVAAKHLPAGS